MDRWRLLEEVFNARGLLLAFFGALGGAVRWALDRNGLKAGLRRVFIGTATAFGLGSMAPSQLQPWIGDIPPDAAASIGTLCATAFIVGFLAVSMLERLMIGPASRKPPPDEDEPPPG